MFALASLPYVRLTRKSKSSVRRKVYPGEFSDDPVYSDVVVMLTRVAEHPLLGGPRLDSILARVPAPVVAKIKQKEYRRVIRMCQDELDSVLD